MIVRLVLWNLADSLTNVADLRRYLQDESVDQFVHVPGLLFKAWVSDATTDRWGALYVWKSEEASQQELPSRARELIGKEPEIVEVFDLEATASMETRSHISGWHSRSLRRPPFASNATGRCCGSRWRGRNGGRHSTQR